MWRLVGMDRPDARFGHDLQRLWPGHLLGLVETPYNFQVPIDLDLLSILQPGRGVEDAGHAGLAIFAGNERAMLQGAADSFSP